MALGCSDMHTRSDIALGLMLTLQKSCEWSSGHDCLSAIAITSGAAELVSPGFTLPVAGTDCIIHILSPASN